MSKEKICTTKVLITIFIKLVLAFIINTQIDCETKLQLWDKDAYLILT